MTKKYKIKTKSGELIGETDSYFVVKYLVNDYEILCMNYGYIPEEVFVFEFDSKENKYKVKW